MQQFVIFCLGRSFCSRKNERHSRTHLCGHTRKNPRFIWGFLQLFWWFFSLANIIFTALMVAFFIVMFTAGYRAFRGENHENLMLANDSKNIPIFQSNNFSDEQKIQILSSFLPIIGIFTTQKNSFSEMQIGRKVGNFFFFLMIFFGVLFESFINFPTFFVLLAYIVLFVTTAVFLMTESKFFQPKQYRYIPTYHDAEAFLHASLSACGEFFKVAFGQEKKSSFQEKFQFYQHKYSKKVAIETPFWTHPVIIGIPILNLITIPSFFNKKFHEYQGNIAEGFFLTILCILIFIFSDFYALYLLIFPIATLIAEWKTNANVRAPITSIARNIFIFFYKTKKNINALQQNNVEEKIVLSENNHPPKNPENIPNNQ